MSMGEYHTANGLEGDRMDRTERTERPARSGKTGQIRRRPGVRMAGGRPPVKPFKLNYRMVLCVAVLVSLLLALIFFILSMVRGGTIKGLNEQVATLTQEKDALTAQVTSLTQDNQTMLTSLAASLDEPTAAETDSLEELIPQLNEGVYVVYSTGSQLQYLRVPEGYLLDRLNAYLDDAAGFAAAEGQAPACTYYVLFSDRVIGLAQGNTGFVSMDRAATGSATSTPAGMYDLVAAMFA